MIRIALDNARPVRERLAELKAQTAEAPTLAEDEVGVPTGNVGKETV